tara:strand:+ start:221 stop:2179 length:1959 start_codon:yes stop_codon:yes gene_type:complete
MALIDLKTDLKSLKFGQDRPGGGSSREPFIKSKIPEGRSAKSPDFLLRNGFLNPINSAKDALRISKFFTTTEGVLFILKQQALILTSPISLGGREIIPTLDQAYNPLQTIAQVAGNSIGFHTERSGALPDLNNTTSKYRFLQKAYYSGDDNRLVNLYRKFININDGEVTTKAKSTFGIGTSPSPNTLFEYIGGPTASKGAKTIIKRTTYTNSGKTTNPTSGNPRPLNFNYKNQLERGASGKYEQITGNNLLIESTTNDSNQLLFSPNIIISGTLDLDKNEENKKTFGPYQFEGNDSSKLQASFIYKYESEDPSFQSDEQLGLDGNENATFTDEVYVPKQLGGFPNTNGYVLKRNNTKVLNQKNLINDVKPKSKEGSTGLTGLTDFRKIAGTNFSGDKKPPSTDYSQFNREKTFLQGNPGTKNVKRVNYTTGPQNIETGEPSKEGVDIINAYDSKKRNNDIEVGDIIKFNMRIINNDSLQDEYLYFRAYIDEFSEAYSADWSEYKYVGRAQKFYTYTGFERSFNLSFTVHAQSRSELLPMWRKLNRLVGAASPDYSQGGYMRGSILKLTVGDYITNHPGILKGFTVGNVLDYGFELGRDENGTLITNRKKIQQLPFGFKVSGFNFISISGGGLASSNYISSKNSSFVGLGLKN